MEDGKNNCLAYKDLIYINVENPFDFFFIAGHNIHVPKHCKHVFTNILSLATPLKFYEDLHIFFKHARS